jgi:hypothetical protein
VHFPSTFISREQINFGCESGPRNPSRAASGAYPPEPPGENSPLPRRFIDTGWELRAASCELRGLVERHGRAGPFVHHASIIQLSYRQSTFVNHPPPPTSKRGRTARVVDTRFCLRTVLPNLSLSGEWKAISFLTGVCVPTRSYHGPSQDGVSYVLHYKPCLARQMCGSSNKCHWRFIT